MFFGVPKKLQRDGRLSWLARFVSRMLGGLWNGWQRNVEGLDAFATPQRYKMPIRQSPRNQAQRIDTPDPIWVQADLHGGQMQG